MNTIFQLTTSQGGRHSQTELDQALSKLSTHDLTRRSTSIRPHPVTGLHFQLTTSQGGRPFPVFPDRMLFPFQLTTSQGGRRQIQLGERLNRCLSTHDLTRRSTVCKVAVIHPRDLSTHDLTRRSTNPSLVYLYTGSLSTHDLTRRSTRWIV